MVPKPETNPEWKENQNYRLGDIVSYNGINYVNIIGHVSYTSSWNPKDAPSLWKKIE